MSFPRGLLKRPPLSSSVRLAAVVLALLLVCWLVLERSHSAFSDTTGNEGNTLGTGSVELTDNDNGSALFNVMGMSAGQSETRCIEVTYSGSSTPTGPIKLYGGYVDGGDANATADSTLAPYLDLTVEVGGAGTSCGAFSSPTVLFDATRPGASAGTVQAFAANHSSWANGLSTAWTPAGGSTTMRPFRITATVKNDNNAQNKIAEPSFTWEVRGD